MEDIIAPQDDTPVTTNTGRESVEAFLSDLDKLSATATVPEGKAKPAATAATSMPRGKALQNQKLMELQQKMNEARAKAKAAREEEKGPKRQPTEHDAQMEKESKAQEFADRLKSEGKGDPDRFWRMHQTQEKLDRKDKRDGARAQASKKDPMGEEAQFKSFVKRERLAAFSREEYEEQKQQKGSSFYGDETTALHADVADIDRIELMVAELEQQDKRRANFSRRRTWNEEDDIYYINDRNRNYNKKIARAFDEHTQDIKDSLERGTAL